MTSADNAQRADAASPQAKTANKRISRACETCKTRKRKCDGHQPCGLCFRYGLECIYRAPSRRATLSLHQKPRGVGSESLTSGLLSQKQMEANSSIAFPHVLGMELNPVHAPKVCGFAWNLGLQVEYGNQQTNITSLLDQDGLNGLADVYFERVHPIYGFVDPEAFRRKVIQRWKDPGQVDHYDSILCGVAALGSLFSGGTDVGRQFRLLQCAKEILEGPGTPEKPMLFDAIAWLLRTIYLRCTAPPHAAWMASCTTMHIIEAIGAHQDPSLISIVYSDTVDSSTEVDSQRRLFWVATILNAWISFEYGRSRVVLPGISCKPLQPRAGDLTSDLFSLYQISELLDPENSDEATDFEDALIRLDQCPISDNALMLSKSTMALTIYRRLRVSSPSISREVVERIIKIATMGLEAAIRLARSSCPWWHVANVPFQFLCILLAIDSKESLSHVGHALNSLRIVAQCFDTSTIRNAFVVAESLVRLCQKKKERDLDLLKAGLEQGCASNLPVQDDESFLTMLADLGSDESAHWDWNAFFQGMD